MQTQTHSKVVERNVYNASFPASFANKMTKENKSASGEKATIPIHVVVTSIVLLLLACSSLQVIFLGPIVFGPSFVISFGLQTILSKLMVRWKVRPVVRTTVLVTPSVLLAMIIWSNGSVRPLQMSALRAALGTDIPADIEDLHVFESSFTDYVVFAFFRCSSNSIQKIISNPIYEMRDHPAQYDLSRRGDWKDLSHMGLVTNLTVYARTNMRSEIGGGEIWVDPEYHFVFVSYGVD